jgi:hypothetical protein
VLLNAVSFMNVRSMIDCHPVFDCHVGVFGVLTSVSLLLSNHSLWCVAWPLVVLSSDQVAWWRFQLPVYIVFCVCGTGSSFILSTVPGCMVATITHHAGVVALPIHP